MPCPPDLSQRGLAPEDGGLWAQTVFWSLRRDKEGQFWDDLTSAVGAPRDKLYLGNGRTLAGSDIDRSCTLDGVWSRPACHYVRWWFGSAHVRPDFGASDVANPKAVMADALDSIKAVAGDLRTLDFEVKTMAFEGEAEDIVDAVAVPVFLLQEAIKSMQQVVEIGKKVEEANEKQFIAHFLMAVFFLIPMVGQGLATVGLGTLARILVTLGEVGSIAQGIADVAEDPESAPFLVLGLVMSAGALRDAGKVGQAARIRRERLTPDVMGKLSPTIKTNLDLIGKYNNKEAWQPKVCFR